MPGIALNERRRVVLDVIYVVELSSTGSLMNSNVPV